MNTFYKKLAAVLAVLAAWAVTASAAETNPQAVMALLARVTNAADRFETVLDEDLAAAKGTEVFVITSADGKPCIKGSSLPALTAGINWYLNHYAHVNLAWNNLTADLSGAALPVPAAPETHTATVPYRYYLNYCTFSYSMSTWTWERWQQEIDWMALHGINMPLQIVGLDVVWRNLLTKDLGYTSAEANEFIAGPCFQAWWGMNNLEGWGGPNPDWWYARQEELCRKILARERELGMRPVLPGYSGMVPSDIGEKGYSAKNQGQWCNFVRPYILDPNSPAFSEIAAKYYARLNELMGTSAYYSMDPFHEGANTEGIAVASAYKAIAAAMYAANPDARWVIQSWQWNSSQYQVLSQVEKGRLIVLDLFSDAHSSFGSYQGHDAVYCMLHNFGGRTGFYGRLSKVMADFFAQRGTYANIKGIGATPEGIEQTPVLYDALFELPWRAAAPDPASWLKDYTVARYGVENAGVQTAWEKLRTSALNCETTLQGPVEAVLCARPALAVSAVSSWGGTNIFYDAQEVARAARLLLEASLSGENYTYDLTDISRQALTDYGYYLLKAVNEAYTAGDKAAYSTRRDLYLQLILDLDGLLNTNRNFMVGRWTRLARGIADEGAGATEADRRWLELDNARTLITTWGDRSQSEGGGLRDYSYREWGGMMKDYYYPRWKTFFDNLESGTGQPDWFSTDWAWAHNASLSYTDVPSGETAEVARELLDKYFLDYTAGDGTHYYIYRGFGQDYSKTIAVQACRGETFACPVAVLPDGLTGTMGIDFNNDGLIADDERQAGLTATIPAGAVTGKVKAVLSLSDGTSVTFSVVLADHITEPRAVSVATADAAQGTVSIEGTGAATVTGTGAVTILATPAAGYDFYRWTDGTGLAVSTANPYTYYGKEAATFTANFIINKWGVPEEDLSEWGTINDYGQYLTEMTLTQNGQEPAPIYSATACPEHLFETTQIAAAPAGSQFVLSWKDAGTGGMGYCRLSAYADLNSDGDFTDSGELLAVVGDKNTTNNVLPNGSLTVLLPYDIPEGLTHVRLRFDGAWMGGQDAATGAMPAGAKTMRMVYDVPVQVTPASAQACTVTVKSADTAAGTVDANGQPDTYTYAAGEQVVLRAYPAAGWELAYWTDSHGRRVPEAWQDGNSLRFSAPESGTYTAHFSSVRTMTVGAWTLTYEEEGGGVAVTGVRSGSGALDLAAANSTGKPVVRIAPAALKGCAALTALTLPATLSSLDRWLDTAVTGAGVADAPVTLSQTIPGGQPWSMTVNVVTDGSSFNQWGSGLLATGTSALADSYDGGLQFYLAAAGTLTVKTGTSETRFSGALGRSFQLAVAYDGTGSITVTATAGNGAVETHVLPQRLDDITSFATALPVGVDITSLVADDPRLHSNPFDGCVSLADVRVEAGNACFSDKDGVLYDAAGRVLLFWPPAHDDPSTGIGAVPAPSAGAVFYDLRGRRVPRPAHGVFVDAAGRKVLLP